MSKRPMHTGWVILWRLLILVALICGWQYLPELDFLNSRIRWLDPFFISSPTEVYEEIKRLLTGSDNTQSVWPYLWHTIQATLMGTAAGIGIGTALGALLSNSEALSRVLFIYVAAMNSIPRIALIPIVVLIVGPTLSAAVIAAILVVTFLAFFNALEGGRSVPMDTLQNAVLLGATQRQVMFRVRLPYVLMWTFAAVPNAISFGLLTVVTTELLTGVPGMGSLILVATTNVDASLGFAVAVILSVVGTILVAGANRLKRVVLHWA